MDNYVRPNPTANGVCDGTNVCRLVRDCADPPGTPYTVRSHDDLVKTPTTDAFAEFGWFATKDGASLNNIINGIANNQDFLGWWTDVPEEREVDVCLKCYDTNRGSTNVDDTTMLF